MSHASWSPFAPFHRSAMESSLSCFQHRRPVNASRAPVGWAYAPRRVALAINLAAVFHVAGGSRLGFQSCCAHLGKMPTTLWSLRVVAEWATGKAVKARMSATPVGNWPWRDAGRWCVPWGHAWARLGTRVSVKWVSVASWLQQTPRQRLVSIGGWQFHPAEPSSRPTAGRPARMAPTSIPRISRCPSALTPVATTTQTFATALPNLLRQAVQPHVGVPPSRGTQVVQLLADARHLAAGVGPGPYQVVHPSGTPSTGLLVSRAFSLRRRGSSRLGK